MKKETILSIMSGIGVVATAVFAVKATEKVLNEEDDKNVIKHYIPAVITGASTILCIFATNRLNAKQQKNLLTAYGVLGTTLQQYKNVTKEICGEDIQKEIEHKVVLSNCNPGQIVAQGAVCNSSLTKTDFYEEPIVFSLTIFGAQRYFKSTISKVLEAEYHINRNFNLRGLAVGVNEFYEFLGLDILPEHEKIGWNGCEDDYTWIDFENESVYENGQLKCVIINPLFEPVINYEEY